jgi:3-phosphoshikimate 1-carboxyvinyltransferase
MAATTAPLVEKFFFTGTVPASKSLMNRALVTKSFFPSLEVHGHSNCADVQHMLKAVKDFPYFGHSDCGEAGTVFRFMALRASRESGRYQLIGTERLLERPQKDLLAILQQLSVSAHLSADGLMVEGTGWKKPQETLLIHREKSSQFSTGLVMSAWNLSFDLEFELHPKGMSDPYWRMTLEFARKLGMQLLEKSQDHFIIPAGQKITLSQVMIEPDYSSAFGIAVAAALFGEAYLQDFVSPSLQPDFAFVEMMSAMKVPISVQDQVLKISHARQLQGMQVVMRDTPDLFPVFAVLCAFADGESVLSGAPRLIYKETDRIRKTSELLNLMRVPNTPTADGIVIQGQGMGLQPQAFDFDPDQDHRMAMAAGILLRGGWKIRLKTPEIVNKSFPEFWQVLGVKP